MLDIWLWNWEAFYETPCILTNCFFAVTPEFKQELLLKCLTLERLAEEETLLKAEMRNYLVYYVDIIVPLLKKTISSCEGKTCSTTTTSHRIRIYDHIEMSTKYHIRMYVFLNYISYLILLWTVGFQNKLVLKRLLDKNINYNLWKVNEKLLIT